MFGGGDAPTTERNIDHELLSASLILLHMYLITYTLYTRTPLIRAPWDRVLSVTQKCPYLGIVKVQPHCT